MTTSVAKFVASCSSRLNRFALHRPQICNVTSADMFKSSTRLLRSAADSRLNRRVGKDTVPPVAQAQVPLEHVNLEEKKLTLDVISKINEQIEAKTHGRLFAIIYVCGKQFKVTTDDLLVLEGYWPPTSGDKIRFDKVLLVGGSDFTLIGRPLLSPSLVNVQATVIEKTLAFTKIVFHKIPRKQYMRTNFSKQEQTMLRINCIDIIGKVNEKLEYEQIS